MNGWLFRTGRVEVYGFCNRMSFYLWNQFQLDIWWTTNSSKWRPRTLGVFNKFFDNFKKRLKFSHWLQNVRLKSPGGTEVRSAWVSRSFIQNKAVVIQSCMTVEVYLLLGWSDELKQKLTKKPVRIYFGVKHRNPGYFPFTWGIKWFTPFHLGNLRLK